MSCCCVRSVEVASHPVQPVLFSVVFPASQAVELVAGPIPVPALVESCPDSEPAVVWSRVRGDGRSHVRGGRVWEGRGK